MRRRGPRRRSRRLRAPSAGARPGAPPGPARGRGQRRWCWCRAARRPRISLGFEGGCESREPNVRDERAVGQGCGPAVHTPVTNAGYLPGVVAAREPAARRTGRPRRSARPATGADPRREIVAVATQLFTERGRRRHDDGRDRSPVRSAAVVALLLLPQQGRAARRDRGRGEPGAARARRPGAGGRRIARGAAVPGDPGRCGGLVRPALRPQRDPPARGPRPQRVRPVLDRARAARRGAGGDRERRRRSGASCAPSIRASPRSR